MKIDEKNGLYGNYGIWHKPFWQTTTFYWVMITIIGFCFLLLCFFLIKKYRAYKKKKKLPAWQRALKELELLRKANVMRPEQSKKFYHLVTMVLKSYLQEQFNFPLYSKTDDEVIIYLEKKGKIKQKLLQDIRTVFKGSIVIKFANEQAIEEQIEHDYNRTVAFIKEMQKEKESN